MRAPDNQIGDPGATALVEAFKKMPNLKELHLEREFWMVDIPRPLTVMRWSKAWFHGSEFTCICKNGIIPILGGDSPLLVITHDVESHHSITQLFCVGAPGNRNGDAGATAPVEAFKKMPNLTQLKLGGELWIFDISLCGQ